MVLVPNRSCEHGGAQAPRRRRSDSGVSRPSTPGWLASLISTGTATVVSPESAGAVGRPSLAASWFASSLSFRAGACLPHQPPKYALGDEESRNDNSRWKTLAIRLPAKLPASRGSVERREASTCKQAEMVEANRTRRGGDTMHEMLKGLHLLAGWPGHDPRPVTIGSVHPALMSSSQQRLRLNPLMTSSKSNRLFFGKKNQIFFLNYLDEINIKQAAL